MPNRSTSSRPSNRLPNIRQDIQKNFGFTPQFEKAKENLEENDGAGNTFKATAKPVLIGTAVVGATTMIFSIIVALTNGLTEQHGEAVDPACAVPARSDRRRRDHLLVHRRDQRRPSLRAPIGQSSSSRRTSSWKASPRPRLRIRKKVVAICTQYAQKGMLNIFLTVFFATLAFAFLEPYFFVGYLISIALFGLYQAIFMANAGGAWDNAKKIVETELHAKGTPLHDATVVGDTVGDPFKDTCSVALNPIIKFTTLFGLLAVSLAVDVSKKQGGDLHHRVGGDIFRSLGVLRLPQLLRNAHRERRFEDSCRFWPSRDILKCKAPLPKHPWPKCPSYGCVWPPRCTRWDSFTPS